MKVRRINGRKSNDRVILRRYVSKTGGSIFTMKLIFLCNSYTDHVTFGGFGLGKTQKASVTLRPTLKSNSYKL